MAPLISTRRVFGGFVKIQVVFIILAVLTVLMVIATNTLLGTGVV